MKPALRHMYTLSNDVAYQQCIATPSRARRERIENHRVWLVARRTGGELLFTSQPSGVAKLLAIEREIHPIVSSTNPATRIYEYVLHDI